MLSHNMASSQASTIQCSRVCVICMKCIPFLLLLFLLHPFCCVIFTFIPEKQPLGYWCVTNNSHSNCWFWLAPANPPVTIATHTSFPPCVFCSQRRASLHQTNEKVDYVVNLTAKGPLWDGLSIWRMNDVRVLFANTEIKNKQKEI